MDGKGYGEWLADQAKGVLKLVGGLVLTIVILVVTVIILIVMLVAK